MGGGGGGGYLNLVTSNGGNGGGNGILNGGDGTGNNAGTGGGVGATGGIPVQNGGGGIYIGTLGAGGGGWIGGGAGISVGDFNGGSGGGGSSFVNTSLANNNIPITYSFNRNVNTGGTTTPGSGGGQNITNNGTYPGTSGQVIITYIEPPVPKPISNICFPAGTPIKTDQGFVNIELIDINKHSIGGRTIQGISQTVTLDNYLISFQPNCLGKNQPDKKTIMSKDHKILCKGQLVPAHRFLSLSREITRVKYSGETLYNVLLEEYGIMEVNNLKCETLDPESAIAQHLFPKHSHVSSAR